MTASKLAKVGKAKPPAANRLSSRLSTKAIAIACVALLALGAIYWNSVDGRGSTSKGDRAESAVGKYSFQVGNPAPGQMAPPIRLDTFNLADQRGKTVLLYFQEGLTCQPCWDQIKDVEGDLGDFRALGIDLIVSITTDPADLLAKKSAAQGTRTPVLSDPDMSVSRAYNTNKYGMMGDARNGHSFIVVGPDGRIKWRADYGGAPDYTMFVPAKNLVADLRRGLGKG